ncbi:glycosyltransferase [Methylomonas sp. MgM2]
MKNLLFVTPSLRPGGAERQLVELIKGLDTSIYNIFIITAERNDNGYYPVIEALGIPVTCFERRFKFDASPIFKTICFIVKNDIGIIHTFLNLGSLIGILAGIITNTPIICSSLRTARDENMIYWACNQFFSYFSDFFVSNSKIGFDNRFDKMRRNFFIIRNGVDFNRFVKNQEIQQRIATQLQLNRWSYKIGMIASISPKKDHATLIKTAKLVLSHYPSAVFLLIGDAPDSTKTQLENHIHSLGLDDNILITGFRSDVDQLIQLLDISILLTAEKFGEGSPNAVIESMVAGIPVIASRGGGTDEIIEDRINGILVEPANPEQAALAIISLIEDNSFAKEIAKRGQLFACEHYSLERYVNDYNNLYKKAEKIN